MNLATYHPPNICVLPLGMSRIKVLTAAGRDLPFPGAGVRFCWSRRQNAPLVRSGSSPVSWASLIGYIHEIDSCFETKCVLSFDSSLLISWKIKRGSHSWQMTQLSWLFALRYGVAVPLNSWCSWMPMLTLGCLATSHSQENFVKKFFSREEFLSGQSDPLTSEDCCLLVLTRLWKQPSSIRGVSLNITSRVCGIFTPLNMLLGTALAQKSSSAHFLLFAQLRCVTGPLQILVAGEVRLRF